MCAEIVRKLCLRLTSQGPDLEFMRKDRAVLAPFDIAYDEGLQVAANGRAQKVAGSVPIPISLISAGIGFMRLHQHT
jgi:hypothetical protein